MHPAPLLATIPPETPEQVAEELKLARSILGVRPRLLRQPAQDQRRTHLNDLGLAAGNLSKRIRGFETADPDSRKTFDALRFVGKVGSHEGAAERERILSAFEIFHDALAELFGGRRAKIEAIKQKIIAARGR